METLTKKQELVLQTFESYWDEHQISPSIMDLARSLNISKATTYEHLLSLKNKGYLAYTEKASRSWRLSDGKQKKRHQIPLLGQVAAGLPILATENIEDWISFKPYNDYDTYFGLRVQGESMIGAHILPGDVIILRQQNSADNGDIVVALVRGEEATVKQFQKTNKGVSLVAMNPDFAPIELLPGEVEVLGRVVEVRRRLVA